MKQLETGLFISQMKYAKNLVKRFGMETSKNARTLVFTTSKLARYEHGKKVDPMHYRSIIGSLLYLTSSRLYIMFSIGLCERY